MTLTPEEEAAKKEQHERNIAHMAELDKKIPTPTVAELNAVMAAGLEAATPAEPPLPEPAVVEKVSEAEEPQGGSYKTREAKAQKKAE